MFTNIYNGKTVDTIVTQQYEVGVYIIINNNPAMQGGSSLPEETVHKNLRIAAIKRKHVIVGGTILKCRSNYPINVFTNIDELNGKEK